MKTRTDLRAGASQPNAALTPLQACKKEKEYWMGQANYMENVLANCNRPKPPQPPNPPYPPTSGGWVGGVYYYDRSGYCG